MRENPGLKCKAAVYRVHFRGDVDLAPNDCCPHDVSRSWESDGKSATGLIVLGSYSALYRVRMSAVERYKAPGRGPFSSILLARADCQYYPDGTIRFFNDLVIRAW
jgi:hypothetical protein